MGKLQAGVYRHYKGGLVLVLGLARHSETEDRLVAYIPLGVKKGPRITVRPYAMFFESVEVAGVEQPRFCYVGDSVPNQLAADYDPLSGYIGADRLERR